MKGWAYITQALVASDHPGDRQLADQVVKLMLNAPFQPYHDRIAYHDYAISTERFHWRSQNSAGPDTPGGRRYLDSATNGWQFQLFVRPRKVNAAARGRPDGEQLSTQGGIPHRRGPPVILRRAVQGLLASRRIQSTKRLGSPLSRFSLRTHT